MDDLLTTLEAIKSLFDSARKSRSDVWTKDRQVRYKIKIEDLNDLLRVNVCKVNNSNPQVSEIIRQGFDGLSEAASIVENLKLSTKTSGEQTEVQKNDRKTEQEEERERKATRKQKEERKREEEKTNHP